MEFYKVLTQEEQSLVDIAMQEYGHVDGVFFLLEDNPLILESAIDEPEPGTVLYIREKPDVADLKRLDYVRKGRIAAVTTNTNLYVLVSNATEVEKQAIADALGLTEGGTGGVVNIFKADNFTVLFELEGGSGIRTTDIIAAMTVNEIIGVLTTNNQLNALLSNYPVILKDTAGVQLSSNQPGAQVTIQDSVAKDLDGVILDQKKHGLDLVVNDTVIFKADNLTQLLSIRPESSKRTSQIIALMSAAEVLADLNSANLTNTIVPLLSSGAGNLSNLTDAQIQALLASQVQQLITSQLDNLSGSQKNYIFTNLPVTSFNYPIPPYASGSAHLYDGYWIRQNVLNVSPTGKTNSLDLANPGYLKYNNAFGNKLRFTDVVGTVNYAAYSNYMIDHLTSLAYYIVARPAATWDTALDDYFSFTLLVNGQNYSGFFVPDIEIVYSIRRHDVTIGLNWGSFTGTNVTTWSGSPSNNSPSTRALTINTDGVVAAANRTATTNPYILCRLHYPQV